MKIISYYYQDSSGIGWNMSEVLFGRLNLLVGISGSGKSRLLNTIFNLGNLMVTNKVSKAGSWNITIEHNNIKYKISIESVEKSKNNIYITKEDIKIISDEGDKQLIKRDKSSFYFNGEILPKLSREQTSIFLLKDENEIKPLFNGFSSIVKRNFSSGDLDQIVRTLPIMDKVLYSKVKERKIKNPIVALDALNVQLFVLKECFPEIFSKICEHYKLIFPFINRIEIKDLKDFKNFTKNINTTDLIPLFCIKEKNCKKWIPLHELSTGMQKVLLVTTDLCSLTKDYIYLLDEYENSLGINSIDFFPTLLIDSTDINQFIITSHHPYIINKINIEDWYILYRKGSDVKIKHGDELLEKFGKSKQDAFIQLINYRFYSEGIE